MILIISTSSAITRLALVDKKSRALIFDRQIDLNGKLSEELLIVIDQELTNVDLSKKEIEEIWIDRGTGSYTGLRIGISTVNLLAFSLNIPIFGFEESEGQNIVDIILNSKEKASVFNSPVLPVYKFPPHITQKKH